MANEDLIRAIDKRAQDRILDYSDQHTLEVGVIKGITLAGASVQLAESRRYLRQIEVATGVELVIGATVVVARVTRHKWVIIGALEQQGTSTATTENTVVVAGVQNFTCTGRPGYVEAIWTASYFDIRCYEVQVNTSASETGATLYVTDNTQLLYYAALGTYYLRVRAVGPGWQRGSWTGWASATISSQQGSYFEPLTDGGTSSPELVFTADGDVIMVEVEL